MLGNAVKRCHATPIVVLSAIVMTHAIEMRILTAATTTMPRSSAGSLQPSNSATSGALHENSRVGACAPISAPSRPRSSMMQTPTPTIVHST